MAYGLFFDWEGETIRLPVNPEKITIRVGNKNKTIDLIAGGEHNLLKEAGLREYSFRVLLPSVPYPFVHTLGDFKEPIFYLDRFRTYKTGKKPVRFIVTRLTPAGKELFGINTLVSFEEYTVEENAGEEGDFWVDLKLKEYRAIAGERVKVEGKNSKTGALQISKTKERPAKETKKEYQVTKGDTLWAIAKRELNDGSRYKDIAALNGIQNMNKISVGQRLLLP